MNEQAEMSFFDHLEVLRWHLFRSIIAWLISAVVIFIYRDWVYDNVIMAPIHNDFISYKLLCNLSHQLGMGDALCMPPFEMRLQGNTVSGPFMSAISIAMIGGLLFAFPYICWEFWRFIKPAFSQKELSFSRRSILWVSLCFFLGGAFGYFILAPFTFNFLATFSLGTKNTYVYLPTLSDYIDSLNNIILGCGIAFELPVMAYVLGRLGIISASLLRRVRKFAIVVIMIVAAFITPSPDWTSQLIVALPLLLLYEISVIILTRIDKKRAQKEKEEWS